MKIFSAQLKGTTVVVEGATASLTGSFTGSIAGIDINSTNTFTASTIARLNSIETISSSNDGRVGNIELFTSSTSARLNSIEIVSASNISRISSLETISASNISRLGSLEEKTGSLATTGSNTFYGTQTFSGSLYVQDNLIVQGSSSLQNITASAVSIGTNIVYLNTDTPAVRFAGLTIQDSGSSAGVTGSMLWDSLCNRWIYSNPSTIGYSGGMLLSGPRAANLGEETTLTCNYIAKSGGGDHLYDSCIVDDGTNVTINGNLKGTANACFTYSVCSCASSTLYAYFDGNSTVLPNPTDRPHIFRTSNGGLGLSANNEGASSQPISMYTCGEQRLTILANGRVGLNTATPLSALDVNLLSGGARRLFVNYDDSLVTIKSANDSQTAETLRVWGDNIIFNVTSVGSGVEAMRITNTCRVGIGTNTPCAVLHISNPAPYIYLTDTSTSGTRPTARIINGDVGTCQSLTIGFSCNDGTTCGLDVLVINEKGNVGIGTNSPGTNLEICSPLQNSSNLRFYNGYNAGASCNGIEFFRNYDAGSNELGAFIKYNRGGGSSGDLILAVGERGAVTSKLRIEGSTGISCFSNVVCAPHFVGLNNISIGSSCTSTDGYNTRFRITCIANDTFVFSFNNQACKAIMYMYGGNTNNPHGYTAWIDNTSGNTNHLISHKTTEATYFAIQGGCFGIGTASPSGKLHVTTDGITASAPQYSWPSYNSEADSNSRRIIFETAGNNLTSTAGHGASLSLVLGNYWDSRVIITPVGSGGASPGDQGTGHGKDFLIKGGTSDNGNGFKGGRLYLNGGIGFQSGYGPNTGAILMQTIGTGGVVRIGACAANWNTNSNVALQVAGAIRFGNPDGEYTPSYGGGISARTLSNFAPGNTTIIVKGMGGSGFLYQVQGFTSTGVRFTDLVFGINNTISVIATATEGGPAARCYTITSENLNMCIGGSATYSTVVAHGFGAVER